MSQLSLRASPAAICLLLAITCGWLGYLLLSQTLSQASDSVSGWFSILLSPGSDDMSAAVAWYSLLPRMTCEHHGDVR